MDDKLRRGRLAESPALEHADDALMSCVLFLTLQTSKGRRDLTSRSLSGEYRKRCGVELHFSCALRREAAS